jgi:uncharacterized RDD family membrane protein YckC
MAEARLDTMQAVELADGVSIRLRVAGPVVRTMAWMIDLLIYLILLFALSLLLFLVVAPHLGGEVTQGIFLLLLFLVTWFYNVLFEASESGRTPGQRAMKLRVASITGGPVTLGQAMMRNLLRVVDFMPGLYLTGFISCLLTRRFQRLGDLVAGTVMLYEDSYTGPKVQIQLSVERVAPPLLLTREEQAGLLQYAERAALWSDARREELADLAEPLTEARGHEGVRRLAGMAVWLRDAEQPKPTPLAFSR